MEINRFESVYGVVVSGAVVEGRMVLYDGMSDLNTDFGSFNDLPFVHVPATAEQAKRSYFVITWPVNNQSMPIYSPVPHYDWALRQGFDQTTNLPMTNTTAYWTWPGNQESMTLPDASTALAFAEGTYTWPTGQYVYSANLRLPGTLVQVCNTAEDGAADAGKLKELATMSDRKVGHVERFDSTTLALTVTIRP